MSGGSGRASSTRPASAPLCGRASTGSSQRGKAEARRQDDVRRPLARRRRLGRDRRGRRVGGGWRSATALRPPRRAATRRSRWSPARVARATSANEARATSTRALPRRRCSSAPSPTALRRGDVIGIVVVSHSPLSPSCRRPRPRDGRGLTRPPSASPPGPPEVRPGRMRCAVSEAIDEVAFARRRPGVDGSRLGDAERGRCRWSSSHAGAPVAPERRPVRGGTHRGGGRRRCSGASLDAVDAEARRALDRQDRAARGQRPRGLSKTDAEGGCGYCRPSRRCGHVRRAVIAQPLGAARAPGRGLREDGRPLRRRCAGDGSRAPGRAPASGASLISLMSLGVTQGTRVRIDATGPRCLEAVHRRAREAHRGRLRRGLIAESLSPTTAGRLRGAVCRGCRRRRPASRPSGRCR